MYFCVSNPISITRLIVGGIVFLKVIRGAIIVLNLENEDHTTQIYYHMPGMWVHERRKHA